MSPTFCYYSSGSQWNRISLRARFFQKLNCLNDFKPHVHIRFFINSWVFFEYAHFHSPHFAFPVHNIHHTTLVNARWHVLLLLVLIGDWLLILLPITCVTTVFCLLVNGRSQLYLSVWHIFLSCTTLYFVLSGKLLLGAPCTAMKCWAWSHLKLVDQAGGFGTTKTVRLLGLLPSPPHAPFGPAWGHTGTDGNVFKQRAQRGRKSSKKKREGTRKGHGSITPPLCHSKS